MFWIVSNTVCKSSESELKHRYDYIKEVTNTKVSPWRNIVCQNNSLLGVRKKISFFQCKSEKGEYGFIITAHITEIPYILDTILSNKRSIIVVNSCLIKKNIESKVLNYVKNKNSMSELFFAKQQEDDAGHLINYVDNIGKFGFETSVSERILFKNRNQGLVKSINIAYDKILV